MDFFSKITNLNNLFNLSPSTDFSYTYFVVALVALLFFGSFAYEFAVKKINNKHLKKSLKDRTTHYKWTFTSVALVLLISRLEGIPILNLKFWWLFWVAGLVVYTYFLVRAIKKDYKAKLKNKERFGT